MKKNKAWVIAIHIAGWLLFLAFPLVFINAGRSNNNVFHLLVSDSNYWLFSLCYFLLFYINSLVLIPKFFLRKQYLNYALIVVLLFAGVYYLRPFDRLMMHNQFRQPFPAGRFRNDGFRPDFRPEMQGQMDQPMFPPNADQQPPQNRMRPENGTMPDPGRFGPPPERFRRHIDTTSLFIFIMIMALSTAVEITQEWRATEQRATLAETGKANAELSFLKAQINPHFLFNTLNNIYTLAVTNNQHTADSIMKLSNIMRYVTDEVSEDFVPLQYEINCIENYIDLQRLRVGKKTEILYSLSGDVADKVLPPLIFMTFIENVFKYGISKQADGVLFIKITIGNNSINLFCRNPVYQHQQTGNRRGIGIDNTRQRLAHLYPEKHTLKIDHTDSLYTVDLTLYS